MAPMKPLLILCAALLSHRVAAVNDHRGAGKNHGQEDGHDHERLASLAVATVQGHVVLVPSGHTYSMGSMLVEESDIEPMNMLKIGVIGA